MDPASGGLSSFPPCSIRWYGPAAPAAHHLSPLAKRSVNSLRPNGRGVRTALSTAAFWVPAGADAILPALGLPDAGPGPLLC